MKCLRLLVVVTALHLPTAVLAGADEAPPAAAPRQVALSDIVAQQSAIRSAIARNDPSYAYLDTLRRSRIASAQEDVFRLAERAKGAGGLSADDQLMLFNRLKAIEALLTKRDIDDRMVCEREAIVGTRRYQMACMTKAERDARADSARKAMMERQACTTQACKGGD